MGIFAEQVARGVERNVITYSSLIRWGGLGRGRGWGGALPLVEWRTAHVAARMPAQGGGGLAHKRTRRLTPSPAPCLLLSAPRSAAEKAGRADLALQLFDRMQQEGCRPNVVTYNSLIAACCHGAALGGTARRHGSGAQHVRPASSAREPMPFNLTTLFLLPRPRPQATTGRTPSAASSRCWRRWGPGLRPGLPLPWTGPRVHPSRICAGPLTPPALLQARCPRRPPPPHPPGLHARRHHLQRPHLGLRARRPVARRAGRVFADDGAGGAAAPGGQGAKRGACMGALSRRGCPGLRPSQALKAAGR
jgi:pentatricopeptide repeat protein